MNNIANELKFTPPHLELYAKAGIGFTNKAEDRNLRESAAYKTPRENTANTMLNTTKTSNNCSGVRPSAYILNEKETADWRLRGLPSRRS